MANVVWRPKYLFATFATCRVVSRRVVLVSRHVVTFMTVSARRHVVPAAMSSRHGRYVATRHAATRQLCRDMARHVVTCHDTSRPLWFSYSKLKKLLTQVSLYSLTTSWVDIFGDPRVQIPPWSILLSLGCTHTMWSSFLYMGNNYRDLCCLNLFTYLFFSLCSDDIVHEPGYSVNFHYVLFIK